MNRRNALATLTGVAAALAAGRGRAASQDGSPARNTTPVANVTLPDWVPAPGTRRNISHNVLADVDPCPARNCRYSGGTGQQAVLEAWCGAAFAAAYGRLGAWITTGGGHGDYFGDEVYAFELDTLRWVRLNDPYPGGRDSVVDYSEGEYAPGVPLSSHTYQHTQYLPPELGGGPKGSLLLVVSYAAGNLAHGTGRAHACDLETGRWSRYSLNKATARINETSGTCFDAQRKVYWRVPAGGVEVEYLATTDRLFYRVPVGFGGGNNFGVNHTCARHPVLDLLLAFEWTRESAATLWALDLAQPTRWWQLETSGPAPDTAAQGMGLEWCPPLRCFVGYKGQKSEFVHKLIPPPADPLRARWRWDTETLAGDAPIGRDKGPRMDFSRFRWAPAIRSFVWVDDRRLPVQAWRLQGT